MIRKYTTDMEQQPSIQDDTRKDKPILWEYEQKMLAVLVPKLPFWITSYRLTWANPLLAVLVLAAGYLAKNDVRWLWATSGLLILHYFADSLDGAVARYRNCRRIQWGYYMDHLLDYVFMACIVFGYSFIIPQRLHVYLFGILALIGTMMIHAYLYTHATGKMPMSLFKFGPTEERILAIILNTIIIFSGTAFLSNVLPVAFFVILIGVALAFFQTQAALYKSDLENQQNQK